MQPASSPQSVPLPLHLLHYRPERRPARLVKTAQSRDLQSEPGGYREELFPDPEEWINPGDAAIYKPFSGLHAGPMSEEKGLLYADIDLEEVKVSRRRFDATGHYARPDVLQLHVNRALQPPVLFE